MMSRLGVRQVARERVPSGVSGCQMGLRSTCGGTRPARGLLTRAGPAGLDGAEARVELREARSHASSSSAGRPTRRRLTRGAQLRYRRGGPAREWREAAQLPLRAARLGIVARTRNPAGSAARRHPQLDRSAEQELGGPSPSRRARASRAGCLPPRARAEGEQGLRRSVPEQAAVGAFPDGRDRCAARRVLRTPSQESHRSWASTRFSKHAICSSIRATTTSRPCS
jgi:hypothetical protein